jgi:NDP-sugar pyrophosphorylase family protein
MNALILAAGFGTRLEKGLDSYTGPYDDELTKFVSGKPKGLVDVKGKPIVDYQLSQLTNIGIKKDHVYIQTNEKYFLQYLDWAKKQGIPESNVFNNQVVRNEDRQGSMRDLVSAITQIGCHRPLLVFASDTLVYDADEKLLDLTALANIHYQAGLSGLVVYYKAKEAFQHGVVDFDGENFLTNFREKPAEVDSGHVNASIYLFSPEKLAEIRNRSEEALRFINILQLLWKDFKVVKANSRLDLGTIEDVLNANNLGE